MFEKLQEMIAAQTGIDKAAITETSRFKEDLSIDSLDMFELVMAMEDEYGVSVPSEELEKLTSVDRLLAYLKANGAA